MLMFRCPNCRARLSEHMTFSRISDISQHLYFQKGLQAVGVVHIEMYCFHLAITFSVKSTQLCFQSNYLPSVFISSDGS